MSHPTADLHYAVYRISDGYIDSVIVYDGVSPYAVQDGYALEKINYDGHDNNETYGAGDYRIGEFKYKKGAQDYVQPTPSEVVSSIMEQIKKLEDQIKSIQG